MGALVWAFPEPGFPGIQGEVSGNDKLESTSLSFRGQGTQQKVQINSESSPETTGSVSRF